MASAITKLATLTPSGSAVATFSGISGSYDDLKIIGSAHSDYGSSDTWAYQQMEIRFNGDSSSIYFSNILYAQGTAAGVGTVPHGVKSFTSTDRIYGGFAPNSVGTATQFSGFQMYIPGYASAAYKGAQMSGGFNTSSYVTASPRPFSCLECCGWQSTAAITSIGFTLDYGDYVAGTSMTLYGITNS